MSYIDDPLLGRRFVRFNRLHGGGRKRPHLPEFTKSRAHFRLLKARAKAGR